MPEPGLELEERHWLLRIEQAGCILPRHVRRGGGGTCSSSLPANASHTQPHEFVAAKASKEPGQCQCSNERSGIHRPGVLHSLETSDLGYVLLLEMHAS